MKNDKIIVYKKREKVDGEDKKDRVMLPKRDTKMFDRYVCFVSLYYLVVK
jgi:hypothetical protein